MPDPKHWRKSGQWVGAKVRKGAVADAKSVLAGVVKKTLDRIDKKLDQDPDGRAFAATSAEAPLWAHTAAKLVAGDQKAAEQRPSGQASLQVVVVERAKDSAEWLEMARPFQRQIAERKAEVIEAAVKIKEPAKRA